VPARERLPALTDDGTAPDAGSELTDVQALEVLAGGELEVAGRIVDASNATLLARVSADGVALTCVYKPVAGERPLWDFPRATLGRREVAAYLVSEAAGFDLVPPTVLRGGPFGTGSVQLWVDPVDEGAAEPGAGLVDVLPPEQVTPGWLRVLDAYGADGEPVVLVHADDERLARMAAFDAVTNNADRKGGHVLRGAGDRVLGVDHGLTFNAEPKLRTVLWGWAGDALPSDAVEAVEELAGRLGEGSALTEALCELLSAGEVRALRQRTRALLRRRRFPLPDAGRPLIPWPPF
jgi:uncharacterized repeat protein (TIGR03843 family)